MSGDSIDGDYQRAALGLEAPTGVERPLVMKFGGSLVEQLGAQLYPSVTATVAELISNAWDADAKNVWVSVPFDEDWSGRSAEIVVLDDGHGMTRAAAQATYLVVGRKRRLTANGDLSEGGRPVHGRKGIGKLAAFGTASYLECTTIRDGETTSFGLDYDELRRLSPDRDYFVDPVSSPAPLVSPDGASLASGTRVRLTGLRVKRKISEDSFMTSMSRRFALRDMAVWINGRPLQRFAIPLEYRLPADFNPEDLEIDEQGWAHEQLASGDHVSWWIGFTAKPLTESEQQGVSVLARDKMAQRPFKFERSQGTTAQLGLEYLVGEVKADWIDSGDDIDTDFIQSNRDQLQLEDARLDDFLRWGQKRLAWALRARQELRSRKAEETLDKDERVGAVLSSVEPQERRALTAVARRLAKLPEVDGEQLADVMRAVVATREDARLREISREISEVDSSLDADFWRLVDRTMRVDAARVVSILGARISALRNLSKNVTSDPGVLSLLAERVRVDPWLLDPRWSAFRSSAGAATTLAHMEGLLLLHEPTTTVAEDWVVIWPITTRAATHEDVSQFATAVDGAFRRVGEATLRAMLVAPSFAPGTTAGPRLAIGGLRCVTWRDALMTSLARHEDWLAFTTQRLAGEGGR
ncbi:ATP-binding protein [Microbacterium sp. bgisy189]|uniref:ATP-binding protein n=1 Tax=Microbacterium sp. bgisy189 TaxID=3413798 RepID=UPI003EB8FC61